MDGLKVIEFQHDRRLVDEYLSLVRRLHRDDSNWVAPLEGATRAALGEGNPFFRRQGNRHRGFAVRRGSELVGHVLATVNDLHTAGTGRVTGALGFLEVEPDYGTFVELITPALHWLQQDARAERVWATMNFDIWNRYRVMVRGFELPAFLGEPRNGPWLPQFLERAGFVRCKGWVSATTSLEFLIDRAPYFESRHVAAQQHGYRIVQLELERPEQLGQLHRMVSEAFEAFFGYTSISLEDFGALVGGFLRLTGTELATVLEDPAGRSVGFSIAFEDPMPLLRRLNGHDRPLHRWRGLFRPASDRALHYMIGVLPHARAAHPGLGSALMFDTLSRIIERGYPQTTFALMAEDSAARYFALDQAETAEREYALYERWLSES